MKVIISYIKEYLATTSAKVHLISMLFLSLLIALNYTLDINRWLYSWQQPFEFIGWYLLLLFSFCVPYLLYQAVLPQKVRYTRMFIALVLLAPYVFAWKMSAPALQIVQGEYALFWNSVLYFPFKGVAVILMLLMLRNLGGKDKPVMGLAAPVTRMTPYFMMLFLMVPLVLAAATQPDFLMVYPKVQHLLKAYPQLSTLRIMLFEIAYGSDFLTIELFFRGFLVIYLGRWVGANSILPMAMLYSVIHFGKPLGECISSFFGGILLGIVSYRTESIWGGLVIHLGIAWLMELAGFQPLFR